VAPADIAPEPEVKVLGALAVGAGVVEVVEAVAGVFQLNSRDSQPLPLEVSD